MNKPTKPYADFPLTPCGNGMWRKIVKGKAYTFGSWRLDPTGTAAVREWLERKDGILAGLDHVTAPAALTTGMTVQQLIRTYLKIRSADVINCKLSSDTFRDYAANLNDFEHVVGANAVAPKLKPVHFSAYRKVLEDRKLGPHAIKRSIACVKVAFNYAMGEEWIEPIRFGRGFEAPPTDSDSVGQYNLRRGAVDKTEIILTRKQVRKLLRSVQDKPEWKALILLMLNTAMNPAELARLQWGEINFESGRLSRRRWKTGKRQEAYLWKRTRTALRALGQPANLVFVRSDGRLWVDSKGNVEQHKDGPVITSTSRWNFITRDFLDIALATGLENVTPYTIRRTSRTIANHCRDDGASKRVMGQALNGEDKKYVKGKFPMSRLKRIALTVHRRLFPTRPPRQMRIAG